MRFRPCIDLRHGRVVQIVGGSLRDTEPSGPMVNFETERAPSEYAMMYRDDQLRGGHVIALGPGNTAAAIAALNAYPGGLQMGGGITPDNALTYIDAGASHVIVTSYVFADGELDLARLQELVTVVGKPRLVLDLSCRRRDDEFVVVTDRWQRFTTLAVSEETLTTLAEYCDEFLVHGVDVEGLRCGIEDELVVTLGQWSPIPVTYAGGATALSDLDRVRELGNGRVDLTIGSALDIFGGTVRYRDVVDWQQRVLNRR